MDESGYPSDKASLLAAIAREHDALGEALAGQSEGRLVEPGPEGWSVKDHLAHLAAWHSIVVEEFDGGSGAVAAGLSEEEWETISEDAANAHLQRRDASLSLQEVRAAFDETQRHLDERVRSWSDERLKQPLPWDATRTFLSLVADNGSRHYSEHRPWIEAIIQATSR